MSTNGPQQGPGSFAATMDRLIAAAKDDDGRPLTNARLAEIMRADGYPAQASYIGELRRGVKTNPTMSLLQALAKALQVPVSVLTDSGKDQERIVSALELQDAMDSAGTTNLALKTRGMSPKSLQALENLAERLRELEGLDT